MDFILFRITPKSAKDSRPKQAKEEHSKYCFRKLTTTDTE